MSLKSIGATALVALATTLCRPALAETTICTQVTSIPWTISAPGVYCLDTDFNVSLSSGAAITINASNVTLDLNRHALTNTAAGYAYGISVSQQKNVVIKNGAVQGFYIGIGLFDVSPYTTSQGNVIEDIAAERNTAIALYAEGQGNVVSHNRVTQTGGSNGAIGIIVFGPDNVVRSNEVLATGTATVSGYAIYGYSTTGLIVEDNRVSGVASPAGSAYGVYLYSSSHSVIRNNRFDKADTSGSSYPQSAGMFFASSTDNAVVGNEVTTFYYGIYVVSGSSAQTSGNIVIGGSVPVVGTTAATTY